MSTISSIHTVSSVFVDAAILTVSTHSNNQDKHCNPGPGSSPFPLPLPQRSYAKDHCAQNDNTYIDGKADGRN